MDSPRSKWEIELNTWPRKAVAISLTLVVCGFMFYQTWWLFLAAWITRDGTPDPEIYERAIRYELPMLTDEAIPVSTALEWGSRFREATDQELTMYRGLWLSPDGTVPPEKVWERDLAYWQYLAWDYEPSWLDHTPSEADPFLRSQPDIETLARQGEEKWLRCTPAEFAAFLRSLAQSGFDRFIARISWAGTPLDEGVMRSLSTIADGQVAR